MFTEPQQGASYEDLLAVARRAEALGFGAFFRSDHYLTMGGEGLPGPSDAWITLAGLARETSTIRLGTLVSSATFRLPGPLAISVAGVDQMSGGRVELGIGAGWFAPEHTAYGIPFAGLGERFDSLEEQLAIIDGLFRTPAGKHFTGGGPRWQVRESPALPKPVQPGGPPIIVGGMGKRRTPRLAARYAAEYNAAFTTTSEFGAQVERVADACVQLDRDPASIIHSCVIVVCCGETEEDFLRRAAAIGREPQELQAHGAAGTVPEVIETLRAWADAGAQRIYLQVLDLSDLDHLDLIAEQVAPALA